MAQSERIQRKRREQRHMLLLRPDQWDWLAATAEALGMSINGAVEAIIAEAMEAETPVVPGPDFSPPYAPGQPV